jgi:heat shock protein
MNDIAEKLAEQRRARAASDDSDDNNDENMDLD